MFMNEIQPHIQLVKNLNINHALLPGDPARVDIAKQFLSRTREIAFNREYKSEYRRTQVLEMSTGMEEPSTEIAVEELANIGIMSCIRISSCGVLQDSMELGDLVIATGAVRDEGTTVSYIEPSFPAISDFKLMQAIKQVVDAEQIPYHLGVIRSHDTFYTDLEDEINAYWSRQGVLGSDMETASLLVVGALRGIKTASILNVVVETKSDLVSGINEFGSGEQVTAEGERKQIKVALEAIASFNI